MILIDIANNMPSNLPSGVDTAKAISEYGFLAVAAGFFIAASAVQQWLNNRRYDRLLKQNEARYESLFNKFTQDGGMKEMISKIEKLVESTNGLLTPIQNLVQAATESSKEECTYVQASRVIKIEIKSARLFMVDATKSIIKQNNIHADTNYTREKVNRVVSNTMVQLQQGLGLFKFNGMKLTYNLNCEESIDYLVETIFNFIMDDSKPSREYDKLSSDIDIILAELQNKIRTSIGIV